MIAGMPDFLRSAFVAMPIGLVFGATVHLAGVSSPAMIRSQFLFEHEIMMKMFMGALSSSALAFYIMNKKDPETFQKARDARGFGDKGAFTAVLGGLIQGVGMAIAGACPGMIFAQIGAGLPTAALAYLGGIVGAGIYGYFHPLLKSYQESDFAKTFQERFKTGHLEHAFDSIGDYGSFALRFATLALSVSLGLEYLVPWRNEIALLPNVNPAWAIPPSLAGFIVGSLQLPVFYLLKSFLGASSGYSVMASNVCNMCSESLVAHSEYAKSFVCSKSTWQVGLGLGIIAGARLASSTLEQGVLQLRSENAPHVSSAEAFLGGLLIVLGARIAGGCASGHGLSGLPALSVVSWFTVPAMFAGAIGTALLLSNTVMSRAEYVLL